jgi:hypothetical protein
MKWTYAVIIVMSLNAVLTDVTLCETQLKYIDENFIRGAVWARRMRDCFGKFPSGVYSENYNDFGSFDQCIDFRHSSATVGDFNGQYCLVFFLYELKTSEMRGRFAPQPSR